MWAQLKAVDFADIQNVNVAVGTQNHRANTIVRKGDLLRLCNVYRSTRKMNGKSAKGVRFERIFEGRGCHAQNLPASRWKSRPKVPESFPLLAPGKNLKIGAR